MVMLKQKTVLLAKVETTYGTDSSPGASDGIEITDASIKEAITAVERKVLTQTLSNQQSVGGQRFSEVTFKVELKGSGTAGTAPRIGPLFRACAFAQTIVSSTSVTYKPTSSSIESCTLYFQIDGRQHIITGARGTVKIIHDAGQYAVLEFSFKGIHNTPTNTALTTPTFESTLPPICKSASFTYNSRTTLVVKMAEIDMQNVIVMRPSLNATFAVAGFEVTGRNPIMTVDPEAQIETSYDFRGDQLTTQRQVSYVAGATAGNICTITVPKYNITDIEYGDREGILIETLKGECNKSAAAGDDEVQIVFT